MPFNRLPILFVVVLVGSCGGDRAGEPAADAADASPPGVYSGVFPCADCPGITTTLWLRADGRFFYRQSYAADDANEAVTAYSLGRWNSVAGVSAIELVGSGPIRTFVRADRNTLLMQTDSDLEHRLVRNADTPEFSDVIPLAGTMRLSGGTASFTECLTELVAPVSKGGDYARFRHQYRSVGGRNKPVYAELEGRYSWSRDGTPESLKIVRFITIRKDSTC